MKEAIDAKAIEEKALNHFFFEGQEEKGVTSGDR